MLAFTKQRERWRVDDDRGLERLYESATAWLLDLATGTFHQLTPWRDGLTNVVSSFSPDGKFLAVSHHAPDGHIGTKLLRLEGSGPPILFPRALGARYSPDGSRLAFLRGRMRTFRERRVEGNATYESATRALVTDLFTMKADGSGVRRLTDTPNLVEGAASWDPSGERLAFTRTDLVLGGGFFGYGSQLIEVNADGSCETTVFWSPELAFSAPAWQPGPGREAGRIDC